MYFVFILDVFFTSWAPGAAQGYFTISLWKIPVQIDLRDQGKKIRQAVGLVLSGAGLPAYHWSQVKWEAPDKFQENYSKANTPCCPRGEVSPPK